MDFKNRIKGSITQTLVKALLQDAGYQIIPLGVEEVIREVAALNRSDYKTLELPDILRKMPDFLVADKYIEKTWLLEVKYRKQWNDTTKQNLGRDIQKQVKLWNPLFLIVFLGNSTKPNNDTPANSIGVIKLEYENENIVCKQYEEDLWGNGDTKIKIIEWKDITWGNFMRIQDVFKNVGTQWQDQTITKVLSILKSLKNIDLFE